MSLNLNHRGGRGTLRERHIGSGKLREMMQRAAREEQTAQAAGEPDKWHLLLAAAKAWEQALPFINYGRPGAIEKETYITNRVRYCKVWGLRLKPFN